MGSFIFSRMSFLEIIPPSTISWIGIAYVLTALICAMPAVYRLPNKRSSYFDDGKIWYISAILLIIIAINLFINGEYTIDWWIRKFAKMNGWYSMRRPIQAITLGALLVSCSTIFFYLFKITSRINPPVACRLVLIGMAQILSLLCLRLVSYHDTDLFLNLQIAGTSMGRWLETLGLVLISVGALRQLMHNYIYQ